MQKAIARGGEGGLVEISSQVYFRRCIEELFNIPGRLMLLVSWCLQCLREANSRFCDITKSSWNLHVLELWISQRKPSNCNASVLKTFVLNNYQLNKLFKGCKPFQEIVQGFIIALGRITLDTVVKQIADLHWTFSAQIFYVAVDTM